MSNIRDVNIFNIALLGTDDEIATSLDNQKRLAKLLSNPDNELLSAVTITNAVQYIVVGKAEKS